MSQQELFTCDMDSDSEMFPHFWEHTIGSGHATLALRADWQLQLKRCMVELGVKHVRFHGILSDNIGTLVNESNELVYSFFNSDQIFDFLLSIGMSPFVELSFMPLALASGNSTVFNYKDNVTPPKDFAGWEALIKKAVQHWVDRYGLQQMKEWFFEVWNEPNLESFWTAGQADYFKLYRHAAKAVKEVNKDLKVGGPATANNAWITDFKRHCDDHEVPYDFISTHHYPTDAFGKPGDDTITQLADSRRSVLRDQVRETRKKAGNTPVYYTEWSTSSNPFDDLHDEPYAAAFIVKTIMEATGSVQGYSYWTFSDIFDENYFSSKPFHGGFGLLTIYGIPKPAYRGYELLHKLGNRIHKTAGTHPTIDVWVTSNDRGIQVMITNSVLPRHPVTSESVCIRIDHIKEVVQASAIRVDDDHANTRQHWINMGSPESLSNQQVNELNAVSMLQENHIEYRQNNGSVWVEIAMPPLGISFISILTK